MEKKKPVVKKKPFLNTIDKYLRVVFIVFASLLGLLITLGWISLLVNAFAKETKIALYVLLGIMTFVLVGVGVSFVLLCIHLYQLIYKESLGTSISNVKALANYEKDLKYCKHANYEELEELNDALKEISKNFEGGRSLRNKISTYEDIELDYLDEEKLFVSEKSLLDNVTKLILASESYRNALVDISYDLGDTLISKIDALSIAHYLNDGLGYANILFAQKEETQGFYVFIPSFDSVSQLHEEIEALMKNIALIRHDFTGKQIVMPFVSVVVYPYSSIDNMIPDLMKAVRQRKPLNFYIPEPEIVSDNKKMLVSALNINNISRLIEEISSIDADPKKFDSNIKKIESLIAALINYYDFSCGGYVSYDDDSKLYRSKFAYSSSDSLVFKEGSRVNSTFVKITSEIADKDNSYFFSSRKHLNSNFARFMSQYRVRSGVIYILRDENKCTGMLYFFNKENNLYLDTYMKANLIISCHFLGDIVKEMENRRVVAATSKRYRRLIKISGLNVYTVDKNTHEIVTMSDAFKKLIPNVEVGEKCYKEIYGLEGPCTNCPLKKNKHMISKMKKNKRQFESYEIMKNPDDDYASILINENHSGKVQERFDDETLLATFFAFKESMDTQYLMSEEGNVVLLHIENLKALLTKFGNAGYVDLIQKFNSLVTENAPFSIDVYLYNKDTMAIIVPNSDNKKIINICEYICKKTFELAQSSDGYRFEFSYIVKAYPENCNDFASLEKALDKVVKDSKNHIVDEIIFTDSHYKRSASEDGYLYETLVDAFEHNTFKMNFQPVVDNKTRLIIGAELFLSVIDKENNLPINIGRAIRVSEKRGYLPTISKAILDHVDALLEKYGYTFFMTAGLNRLSINMGYSFFEDETFIKTVQNIITKNSLPKGFLGFEVREDDIKAHAKEYAEISKDVYAIGASMVCDQYHGDIITAQEIADAGFKEVKVSRDLVTAIKDKAVLEKVLAIWDASVKAGLDITFLGIENRIISEAIHNDEHGCWVQGNYFFTPMSEEALFESIRQRNMRDKEMDT